MKSNEKKGILILILVSIVIIAVIYGLTRGSKDNNTKPIQANQAIQNNHKLTQAVESLQKQKVMVQL